MSAAMGGSTEGEEEEDCRSVRSLPLLADDDYFYYQGTTPDREDGDEEYECGGGDEEEHIDHFGALIGSSFPISVQCPTKQRSGGKSLLEAFVTSQASEKTCDSTSSTNSNPNGHVSTNSIEHVRGFDQSNVGSDGISLQDFVSLKVRVADLESQLQLRGQDSLPSTVWDLQARKLSLECENVGLKQMLRRMEEDMLEARKVQSLMQEKMSKLQEELAKADGENKVLREENRRWKEQQQKQQRQGQSSRSPSRSQKDCSFRRRSMGELECPYPDEENSQETVEGGVYLPFPTQSRRATTGERPGNLICSFTSVKQREARRAAVAEQPPLLRVLRSMAPPAMSRSRGSPPPMHSLESGEESGSRKEFSSDASESHEWRVSRDIGASPSARPEEDDGHGMVYEDHIETLECTQHSDADAIPRRPQLCRSWPDFCLLGSVEKWRREPKRGASFTLSDLRATLGGAESDGDDEEDCHAAPAPPCPKPKRRRSFTLGGLRSTLGGAYRDDERGDRADRVGLAPPPRPKPKRSSSFTLSGLRSTLGMESGEEDEFDVRSVLWDSDDEDDMGDDCTIAKTRSFATAAF